MENKTTLTFAYGGDGDENFYLTLSSRLAEMLSEHTVEWRHTYGRTTHSLKLRSKVLPLTQALLDSKELITKPYFHVFWVDCTDSNQYTYCVKSKISLWLDQLSKSDNNCGEWMLIVLVNDVLSRITKAKLPLKKSAIADRIKSDFCQKSSDRIQILYEATKDTTKSGESWQALVGKVALITVRSMENQVSAYEEKVRSERERRNEKSWDFCNYFIMQEELAFMYEMLGMFNSALVQYDELDAMFTQYIVNARSGDVAHWLSRFSERPITGWGSLLLWKAIDTEARGRIMRGSASLIDVRNYLFARLSHLLLRMGQPHKVARRMYYFLHSIANEMKILEIRVTEGAVDCWMFMCALELVHALQLHSNKKAEESGKKPKENGIVGKQDSVSYSNADAKTAASSSSDSLEARRKLMLLENAVLWNMARDKLFALGKLCGLLPGPDTTSEQLNKVVDLLAGMGSDEERVDDLTSPNSVLREALSSKSNFRRHYFELAELAMGTFKHMGRYRAARNIGAQLAEFYMLAGEAQQGESYLLEWSRMFAKDGWSRLESHANEKLAACYKQSGNVKKYVRLCYQLMCDGSTADHKRSHYCQQLIDNVPRLHEDYALNICPMATLTSVRFMPARLHTQRNSKQSLRLNLHLASHLPSSLLFQQLQLALHLQPPDQPDEQRGRRHGHLRNPSNASSVFKVAIESDEEEGDESAANSGNYPNQRRRQLLSSTSCSIKELALEKLEMGTDGTVQVINVHQFKRRQDYALNGSFDEKLHTKEGELWRASLSCRHAKSLLRRQDSTQSQFGKHGSGGGAAVSGKSVVVEKCDHLLTIDDVHLRRGNNQLDFRLKTEESGSFRVGQFRAVMPGGKMFFVNPAIYPTIVYTVCDKKPTIDVDVSQVNGKMYAGLPFPVRIDVELGDRRLKEGDWLTMEAPSGVRMMEITSCTVTDNHGIRRVCDDVRIECDEAGSGSGTEGAGSGTKGVRSGTEGARSETEGARLETEGARSGTEGASSGTEGARSGTECAESETAGAKSGTTITRVRLPTADAALRVSICAKLLREIGESGRDVDDVVDEEEAMTSSPAPDWLRAPGDVRRHKRAHSAPMSGVLLAKMAVGRGNLPLTMSDKDDNSPAASVNSLASDFVELTLDDEDDDDESIDGEMTEVELNEAVSGGGGGGDVAERATTRGEGGVVDKMMEFLKTPGGSHKKRVANKRSASAERSVRRRERSPREPHARKQRHLADVKTAPTTAEAVEEKRNDDVDDASDKPEQLDSLSFRLPWNDVAPHTSRVLFHRALAFNHWWSFPAPGSRGGNKRYLSVSVENLTDRMIRLSGCALRLIGRGGAAAAVDVRSLHGDRFKCKLRPDHTCTYAWQVSDNDDDTSPIDALFSTSLSTATDDDGEGSAAPATYAFALPNTRTVYSVSCRRLHARAEPLRCGVMTSLRMEVRRLRDDAAHTTTNAGQQLLMFQVMDKRGGWAICGKSSGILTFPVPSTVDADEEGGAASSDSFDIQAMPLLSGNLHLPNVVLHRYVKRTTEFDEKLSSTDSPVFKPPKLKAFKRGEVVYVDQSKRLRVLAQDQPDETSKSTTL